MKYEVDIDLEDLGITTEDLVSLAEDNGDRLYDQDDLDYRIEEEVANAVEESKNTIKLLEEENAALRTKAVDLEAIALYVQTALRVEALSLADCIRTGNYNV